MKYLISLSSFFTKAKDAAITAEKISFGKLDKSLKELQGKYIDIEGLFWQGFENTSICPEFESIKQFIPQCYWLGFNKTLYEYDLKALSGHRVRIKGRIDTVDRGHLGMYRASVKDIYFMEAKK